MEVIHQTLSDWWEYDIQQNSWSQKTSLPGNDRHHPFYFGIGDLYMLVLDMVQVLDLAQIHLQESVFIMIFIDMTHPMIHGYV